jgi:hypothetical protein
MERLIELSLYVEEKLKTARRVVTDSRAIASGRQFLFHAPHVSTTTSPHITAPCGCTVSTSHRGAAVSRTSLTVLQVLSLVRCCLAARLASLLRPSTRHRSSIDTTLSGVVLPKRSK